MDTATFYVNAPLSEAEHEALATLAKGHGRAKGQELRALAVAKLYSLGLLKPSRISRSSIKRKGKA